MERAPKRARGNGLHNIAAWMNPMTNPMAMMMNPMAMGAAMGAGMVGGWPGQAALMQPEEEVVESPPVKAPAPEPPAAAEPPRGGVAVTVAGDSFAEAYASLQSCRSSLYRSEMKIPRCVGYLRLLPKARTIVIHDRDLSLDAQND